MNASPVRRARSTMSSSSKAWSVASPATMASWFMEKVVEWTRARSIELNTLSKTWAERQHGPDGDVAARQRLGHGDDVGLEAPVLVAEELAGPPQPGLDLVHHEERPVAAAQLLDGAPVLVGGHVDALALDGLDDEGGHVAAAQLAGQGVDVAEGHHVVSGRSGPKPSRNSLPPLSDSAPVVSPWKAWSQ